MRDCQCGIEQNTAAKMARKRCWGTLYGVVNGRFAVLFGREMLQTDAAAPKWSLNRSLHTSPLSSWTQTEVRSWFYAEVFWMSKCTAERPAGCCSNSVCGTVNGLTGSFLDKIMLQTAAAGASKWSLIRSLHASPPSNWIQIEVRNKSYAGVFWMPRYTAERPFNGIKKTLSPAQWPYRRGNIGQNWTLKPQ